MFLIMSQGVAAQAAEPEKAASRKPPTFDVVPHCRAVAEQAKPIEYYEVCLRKEQEAREEIVKQWSQFHPADRSHCAELSATLPEPTYIRLLSCLEVARDARKLHEKDRSTTRQR
jgi:hypothetical protein